MTENNGFLRTQKIIFNGLAQAFNQTYGYDDLNRLLSAEEKVSTATTWKQTFSYDRFGNRRFDAANTTTLPTSNKVTNPNIDTSTNRFSSNQRYKESRKSRGDFEVKDRFQEFRLIPKERNYSSISNFLSSEQWTELS